MHQRGPHDITSSLCTSYCVDALVEKVNMKVIFMPLRKFSLFSKTVLKIALRKNWWYKTFDTSVFCQTFRSCYLDPRGNKWTIGLHYPGEVFVCCVCKRFCKVFVKVL